MERTKRNLKKLARTAGDKVPRLKLLKKDVDSVFVTGLPWVLNQSGKEQQRYSTGFKYGLAVLLTVVMALVKVYLDDLFGSQTPFLLSIIAVVLSALFGGTGPGILSMVLTVIFVSGNFLTFSSLHFMRTFMFVVESLFMILLLDLQRKTQKELVQLNQELEMRVVRRTQELEDLNMELQRSNRELDGFAHVASHDLQEPLRKIQAFSDRLEVKLGAHLPADALDYMERMRRASNRMRILINDLLTFSRITTRAQPFELVDLNVIVKEVLEDLEFMVERTDGEVTVRELSVIDADPTQMRQLFQNLISNGLKFSKPGERPVVKVFERKSPVPGFREIVVEDQGIGFDEKYVDRIFNVFQRLHGKDEYEGTGVGLAVCRKIVERHGGTITGQSSPGKGARFIVALPINQTIINDSDA